MNSTTNKQQSMLKCSNCLSVPLIQSLSFYTHSSYIQYECKCGKSNTSLNNFLKYCVYQLKNNDSIINDDSQLIYCNCKLYLTLLLKLMNSFYIINTYIIFALHKRY